MNANNETVESLHTAGSLPVFAAGAAIGVAVGVAAALIFAPASGRDARAYLKRRSNELGHEAMQRGREAWREQSNRVKSAIATGWERAGSAMSEARRHGDEAYREVRESRHIGEPSAARTGYRSESYRAVE